MITTQFTLYMENRPGMLARVTKLLADARLNIEGISASGSADIGLVQLVTSSPDKARKLLVKAAIPFVSQEVVLVGLRNRPGELARIVAEIARSGINLNYVYATSCEGHDDCRCYAIISAPKLKRVDAVCKRCAS